VAYTARRPGDQRGLSASSPPPSNNACHAVMPATGSAAACSWLTPAGFFAIAAAGAVVNSA
jgi:hypothetical protein